MKQISKQLMTAACQPHSKQSQEHDKKETQRKADHLWDLMSQLYTDKWIKKNGAVASSIWIEAIGSLSGEQLRLGVERCKEQIFSGNKWSPDLADFLAMIHGKTDVDFHTAFIRCLDKKPLGRAEKYVYEKASFNIRTAPHDKAERMHRKFLTDAIAKELRGELELNEDMLKALPPNSVKNLNDLKREEYENSHNKLNPRIQKILDSKK